MFSIYEKLEKWLEMIIFLYSERNKKCNSITVMCVLSVCEHFSTKISYYNKKNDKKAFCWCIEVICPVVFKHIWKKQKYLCNNSFLFFSILLLIVIKLKVIKNIVQFSNIVVFFDLYEAIFNFRIFSFKFMWIQFFRFLKNARQLCFYDY